MWTETIRRWTDRPQDARAWTLGKLPREVWTYLSTAGEPHVALGTPGLYCLHTADELPEAPGPHTHLVHAQSRHVSELLLQATGERHWPTSVAVLRDDQLEEPRARFGIHYVAGDQLLRWLLTQPAELDPGTRDRWAAALRRGRRSA
jgi:hypothetical protein